MPVERDINLDKPLTDEDIRSLEEEADRLEKLAQEAQTDAGKAREFQKEEDKLLNDAIKKIEKLEKEAEKAEKARLKIGRTIREVNELATHRTALGSLGGTEEFAEREEFGMGGMVPGSGQIQRGRTAFGTGEERAPLGGLMRTQRMFEAHKLEMEKKTKEAQKLAKKERAELAKKVAENRKMVTNVQKGFQEMQAISRNPFGFLGGRLRGMIGTAGMAGLIAVVAFEMTEQIISEVKKMFGPGGPFDIRKQMLDRDRELIELDHILDRRAGRVFFTSDTDLIQGPPEVNAGNTDRITNRTVRYQVLHLGE